MIVGKEAFFKRAESMGVDLDEFESCDLIKDRVYKLTNNAKKRFNINV